MEMGELMVVGGLKLLASKSNPNETLTDKLPNSQFPTQNGSTSGSKSFFAFRKNCAPVSCTVCEMGVY